jgi:hypothetical protein
MELPVSYGDVFNVNKHNFNEIALEIFRYQSIENKTYGSFLKHIGCNITSVTRCTDIPFLPIDFFKTHSVQSGSWKPEIGAYFESSSTTGKGTSKHYFKNPEWYQRSFLKGFELQYGDVSDVCILALLPNYQENPHSSLIKMVNGLIEKSNYKNSGFYLNDASELINQLLLNETKRIKTILFGVSFALLDMTIPADYKFQHLAVLETGGMKGRRKEITRKALHDHISKQFTEACVHSEYGMTELFSQAYLTDESNFITPPWMQVHLTQLDDPFSRAGLNKTGIINVIDLANVESCSFIATADIGKMHKDGSFEVLGRYDYSEQRGCNLLIA